jgi:hypothetical protein
MRRVKIFFLLLIFNAPAVFAQINYGAKEIAMGSSNVAMSDNAMSIFGNPAGSAQIDWSEISAYYAPSYFGMKELATASAAGLVPFSFGVISGGFSTYGFELFRETTISLSYSRLLLNKIFLGLALSYKSLKIARYGNAGSLLLNFGGIFYILPQLRFGFAVKNFTRSTYKNYENQIPSIISAGVSINPVDEITVNASIVKDLEYPVSARFGLEYGIFRYLDLRFGYRTEPNSYTGGVGIKYKNFELDYALFTHEDLPLSHQLSVIIALRDITERNIMISKRLPRK